MSFGALLHASTTSASVWLIDQFVCIIISKIHLCFNLLELKGGIFGNFLYKMIWDLWCRDDWLPC